MASDVQIFINEGISTANADLGDVYIKTSNSLLVQRVFNLEEGGRPPNQDPLAFTTGFTKGYR